MYTFDCTVRDHDKEVLDSLASPLNIASLGRDI